MRSLFLFLVIGALAVAAEPKTATLSINAQEVAKTFSLYPVFHTAEVKPNGTVLDDYCGKPEELRGTEVCLAEVVGQPNQFYVVLHRGGEANTFVRASLTVIKTNPPINLYSGFGVERDEAFPKYFVEKAFDLEVYE